LRKEEDMKKKLFEKKRTTENNSINNNLNENINESNNGSKSKLSFNMYVEDESDNNDFEDISWTERKI